ncbi:MAG: hypothetical protein ACFCUS_00925 [Rubrimonas sp.]|uniref:hypothetical protein n=1 Tax=Rubrimonas sp. TaxID=2036015 RepID=UPI002FDDB745
MTDLASALARAARLGALAAVGFAAIAVELAPIPAEPGAIPNPDLLLCVLAAAALRAPGATPAPLVFALGLARDLLGAGPIGAGALGLTLAVEALRVASEALRRRSFAMRWAAAAGAAAASAAVPWLLCAVTLAPSPALGDLALRIAATAAVYPLAALAMRAATPRAPRRGVDAARGPAFARSAL